MKILIFAASLRKDSLNKKLVTQTKNILSTLPHIEIDLADFREFEMPIYDGDLESTKGIPKGALELITRLQSADALIVSTPEYNGSIPGSLKNALDWVSRAKPNPFDAKPVLLLGASPGALGSIRGLWHSRVPFEALGAFVYPQMFGLAKAHEAFDESGTLKDSKNLEQLTKTLSGYLKFVSQA